MPRNRLPLRFVPLVFISALSTARDPGEVRAAEAQSGSRPRIRASEVVFMYTPEDPGLYRAFSGTTAGWGGRPGSRDASAVESFRRRVEAAHGRGLRYCASLDIRVDFRGFIEFRPDDFLESACRDLDGQPMRVPWLWDHRYRGHPAYWFCTNQTAFVEFLHDQVERACLAPIDGLHIDDWSGTAGAAAWGGGCFCTGCLSGFRAYLGSKVDTDTLGKLGIESIQDLDYRRFLLERGITSRDWKERRDRCPLAAEFQAFQDAAILEVLRNIFAHAERLRGKPLLRSVNTGLSAARHLLPASIVDYFCGEVHHRASGATVDAHPVFVYRLAAGLGLRQTATAAGQDWAWIKANEKPGLVRSWIAQAYAFGSTLMVPHRQWCYTGELGTHWWHGKPEDFGAFYRFVRENAQLLDHHVEVAPTALVFEPEDFARARRASIELTEACIPHEVLIVLDRPPGAGRLESVLARARRIVVGPTALPDSVARIIERTGAETIPWDGKAGLVERVPRLLRVESRGPALASLRRREGEPALPLVCHVLNRDYERANDSVHARTVRVAINVAELGRATGRSPSGRLVLHTPASGPVEFDGSEEGGFLTFEIASAGAWSLVEIATTDATVRAKER